MCKKRPSYPDDGGSSFCWNIGTCLHNYTVSLPRRRSIDNLLLAPYRVNYLALPVA
jgi:hypothetical protein